MHVALAIFVPWCNSENHHRIHGIYFAVELALFGGGSRSRVNSRVAARSITAYLGFRQAKFGVPERVQSSRNPILTICKCSR